MGSRKPASMEEPVLTGIELEDPLSEQERSFRGNEYNHLRPQVDEQEHYKYRRSNNVQKLTICLVLLMFAFLIVVLAVASATFHKLDDYIKSDKTVTVAYVSLGLPGYESYSWDDVLTRASGQTVRFNMWAGDTTINHWVKDWLAPKMLENYNIQIELVRLNDTVEAVETIAYEIGKGWTTNGTVDLVWINGENFRTAKEAGYLYGPFATKLPNAANFDFNSDNIKYDFGYPTNDYEMPYNGAQVVFIYNTKNITSPPLTIPDLVTWIKSHPGKFTYAAPPDFTGSVFVRHFWYSYASPYSQFLGNFNEKLYDQYASGVYKVLREIEPYLIQKNGAAYYPESQSDVDIMFKNGEVLITLSYDPQSASANVDDGFWNSTVQAYVLSTGTIANTNFVAIASNAENKLAAIVTANFIASFQAMFVRAQPAEWGALQVYNPSSTAIVSSGWETAFDFIPWSSITPSHSALDAAALPELQSSYLTRIEQDWAKCVVNYTLYSNDVACKV